VRTYFADENVLRLQVSVEDIHSMTEGQTLQQLVVKRLQMRQI